MLQRRPVQSRTIRLAGADGALDNPLKGWAAYSEEWNRYALPARMAYFYVSWRELEPERGRYRFAEWEASRWENTSARGKHIVFRLYLDYPNLPTGVPQWVVDSGVAMRPYNIPDIGRGMAPDYDDPRLLNPLLEFIAALGERYNRNARVAFIALGTLGFWGEWHTWPRHELFASEATQRAVVQAYRRAFPNKVLLARYPYPATSEPWLGYHDDMFPEDTDYYEGQGYEWYFLPQLRKAGRENNWKIAAIGAEMVPNQGKKYLSTEWAKTRTMLERMHLTWVGPYCPILETNLTEPELENARWMVRRMGYQYRLTEVAWRLRERNLSLQVRGVNEGVAPFYYPWAAEIALLRPDDSVAQVHRADVDITRWLPGDFYFGAQMPLQVGEGRYRLAIGIRDPWRNTPDIRFANKLPYVQGWNVVDTIGL
ncbi:MAG: DUF4832 domain-containing protein [Armatimonadota bacterium]|nr:DUF4832 domain-containing protein [bacterium]MDW8321727.1 DUF4832 domain-containing protein [Armatimonadota bacterium]